MHSPEAVFEDIEGDRNSREGEVRLMERLIEAAISDVQKSMLRRSLVLLTYAHLEGFCKFSLLAYTAALNSLGMKCADATYPIASAGLAKVFAGLRNPNSKHEAFRRQLPDDAQLHLAAREQIFIESYETIVGGILHIPDQIVDTKSNLSADILKKMLFQLGLSYPMVQQHEGNIQKLLRMRNAIAHGDRLKTPSEKDIEEYTLTTFSVMKFLQNEIYGALKGQLYLRATVRSTSVEKQEPL